MKDALWGARRKILVFMSTVVVLVTILGTLVYIAEGEGSGFTSIPRSIYWAIVTVTTVGYGDITSTVIGQTLASFIMLIGYAIIAVPTGVSAEMVKGNREKLAKTLSRADRLVKMSIQTMLSTAIRVVMLFK